MNPAIQWQSCMILWHFPAETSDLTRGPVLSQVLENLKEFKTNN